MIISVFQHRAGSRQLDEPKVLQTHIPITEGDVLWLRDPDGLIFTVEFGDTEPLDIQEVLAEEVSVS